MSPKLAKEVSRSIKKLDNEKFFTWFETLNYIPLINPQTFQLDMKKKINQAIRNLEDFDYVVPYEEYNTFLNNIDSNIVIKSDLKMDNLSFSISQLKNIELKKLFIGKDIELYEKSKELWTLIRNSQFKPLRDIIEKKWTTANHQDYVGSVKNINATSIEGWVLKKDEAKPLEIKIYKNDILIHTTIASRPRPVVQKITGHLTDKCGFSAIFNEETFKVKDKIEVKISNTNILVELEENVKTF
ncbi:MAG: hypothetical protein U9O64_06940 [Campylobacterota bacterium]|nr:hypothetical protein [Campylobacterota bacterium]